MTNKEVMYKEFAEHFSEENTKLKAEIEQLKEEVNANKLWADVVERKNVKMDSAEELRKITNYKNKYESKQFKYTLKLFRKLNRLARRGKSKYIITPYYMPSWFTNEYEEQLINTLKDYEFDLEIKANYNGQGGFYRTLIIRW